MMEIEEGIRERMMCISTACVSVISDIKCILHFGPYGSCEALTEPLHYKAQLEKDLGKLLFGVALMVEHKGLDHVKIMSECSDFGNQSHKQFQFQDLDVIQNLQNQIAEQVLHEKNCQD